MLVYVDESGVPHVKDPTYKPVLLAVCISEKTANQFSQILFGLKRDLLRNPNLEVKSNRLLNKRTFERVPQKREFVEGIFETVNNIDLKVFAVVMDLPTEEIERDPRWLPIYYRYLLSKIAVFMANDHPDELALIIHDQLDPKSDAILAGKVSDFIFRSAQDSGLKIVIGSLLFVDSFITPGIQLADLFAGALRQYEERRRLGLAEDHYASALKRFYNIVKSKAKDYANGDYTTYGIQYVSEYSLRKDSVHDSGGERMESPEAIG